MNNEFSQLYHLIEEFSHTINLDRQKKEQRFSAKLSDEIVSVFHDKLKISSLRNTVENMKRLIEEQSLKQQLEIKKIHEEQQAFLENSRKEWQNQIVKVEQELSKSLNNINGTLEKINNEVSTNKNEISVNEEKCDRELHKIHTAISTNKNEISANEEKCYKKIGDVNLVLNDINKKIETMAEILLNTKSKFIFTKLYNKHSEEYNVLSQLLPESPTKEIIVEEEPKETGKEQTTK